MRSNDFWKSPVWAADSVVAIAYQNMFKYSELLDNAVWDTQDASVLADQENDLEGNATLEQITITNDNQGQFRYYNGGAGITTTENTLYYLSWDAKRGTGTEATYAVLDATASQWITAQTSYYSEISATVSRVTKTFTTPASCIKVYIYLVDAGDGASGTVFVGRAQINTNNSLYIETTTDPVE